MPAESPSRFGTLLRAAARAYLGVDSKSVWGGGTGGFLPFMGINNAGGGDFLEDSPSDYSRAATLESYVYKCLTIRQDAIVQAPLKVFKRGTDGTRGDAVDHDALTLLRRGNPMIGQPRGLEDFMRYTVSSLDLHGKSAFQLATNMSGKRPTEVYWLTPTSYTPERTPDGLSLAGLRLLGNRQLIPVERCVYLKTVNLEDPFLGTSKIKVLLPAINLRRFSVESNLEFFKNSQEPGVVVSGSWENTDDNMQRIRRAWAQRFRTEKNRSPLFVGGNAKVSLLRQTNKDAEWVTQQRLIGEEVSSVFKVPLVFLNNWEHSITNANFEVAKTELWHNGIMPDADAIAVQLTTDFLWRFWPETFEKYEFGFDYTQVDGLSEDANQMVERTLKVWDAVAKSVEQGNATPNQIRPIQVTLLDQLGLDSSGYKGDVNGGDETLAPWAMIPRGQHSAQMVIDGNAARGTNAELVESVPGAPNASANAQRVADRQTQAQQAAAQAAADRARAQQSPSAADPKPATSLQSLLRDHTTDVGPTGAVGVVDSLQNGKALDATEIDNIVRLAVRAEVASANRGVKAKGPHPVRVREVRLARPQELLTQRLKKHFQKLQNESLRTLRGGKSASAAELKALPDPTDPLYDAASAKTELLALVQEGIISAATAAYLAAQEDYGISVAWDAANPWLPLYMGKRIGLIDGIDGTTQDALRATLTDAATNGETIDQAAGRVTDVFAQAIGHRSKLIARTELMQAYGSASLQSYRDAGLALAEMYDGTDFDEECADVNGQVLSLDDADALMGDEHPNGSRAVAPYMEDSSGQAIAAAAPKPHNVKELGPGIRLIA